MNGFQMRVDDIFYLNNNRMAFLKGYFYHLMLLCLLMRGL